MNGATTDHHLNSSDDNVHTTWSNAHDPVLSVNPGDIVEFECRDATDGRFDAESTVDDVRALAETSTGHPLTGPVEIDGARPGDVLAVDLLGFDHEGIGFSYFFPGQRNGGCSPRSSPNRDSTSGISMET